MSERFSMPLTEDGAEYNAGDPDRVTVVRDLVVIDINNRPALAGHMHTLYAKAGDALVSLACFREFRGTRDLDDLEDRLDELKMLAFLLESGFRAG